jgi:hypothetical protein
LIACIAVHANHSWYAHHNDHHHHHHHHVGGSSGRILRCRRQCEVRAAHGFHHHHAVMERDRIRAILTIRGWARPCPPSHQMGDRLLHQSSSAAESPMGRGKKNWHSSITSGLKAHASTQPFFLLRKSPFVCCRNVGMCLGWRWGFRSLLLAKARRNDDFEAGL